MNELTDINEATFRREAERVLSGAEKSKAIANFANLKTPQERVDAFLSLKRGKSQGFSTKLGRVSSIK